MVYSRRICLALGLLLTLGASLPAEAFTKTQLANYDQCRNWCYGHNTTQTSQNVCVQRCIDYWSTHVSMGPSDPSYKSTTGGAAGVGGMSN